MSNQTTELFKMQALLEQATAELNAEKFETAVLTIHKLLFSTQVSTDPLKDLPEKLRFLETQDYYFTVVNVFKVTKKAKRLLHQDLYVRLPRDTLPYCLGARLSPQYLNVLLGPCGLSMRDTDVDDDEEEAA